MAQRSFWEATGRSADLLQVISVLLGLGNAVVSVLLTAGGTGPDAVAVTTTGAMLVTGIVLLWAGVQSRLDSYRAFAPDRGRRATICLRLGTLLLLLALLAAGILAWGAHREPGRATPVTSTSGQTR
ncbi:hypothetical protein GCM10023194_37720 [Planotetraspora phitsanulokensis]|uniref:Uncharacterized protein n=1 Tax=Planotetraspora phitsanulokensis TaxID=575192 RepID=A0A8J3UDD2_9ACTN|nr:hypothetical protein [Planotetraspora phitsanulokensis]GII41266.1 hypothetical protein Pph01_62690 [Planotetraspora phitsanulokensis]